MARRELGDLQLAILRVLWERKEATAADVHADLLDERGLAPTTIATMLRKLEDKGVVKHRVDGRRFLYRATVDRSEVRRSMVGALIDRLFHGDGAALVNHLLEEGTIEPNELEKLRKSIAERSKGGRRGDGRT
jgi:predicted transcriptional regulator